MRKVERQRSSIEVKMKRQDWIIVMLNSCWASTWWSSRTCKLGVSVGFEVSSKHQQMPTKIHQNAPQILKFSELAQLIFHLAHGADTKCSLET